MRRQHQVEKLIESMRLRDVLPQFLQQRLQVFLRGLERMNRVPPLSHLVTSHRSNASLSNLPLDKPTPKR